MLSFLGIFLAFGFAHAVSLQGGFEATEAILIDGVAQSCRAQEAGRAHDIGSLYMNVGPLKIDWVAPSSKSRLKVLYVKFFAESSGLETANSKKVFAGRDLGCIFGDVSSNPELSSGVRSFVTPHPFLVGDLFATDPTQRTAFDGLLKYVVYAVVVTPGLQDQPTQLNGQVAFKFDGIY